MRVLKNYYLKYVLYIILSMVFLAGEAWCDLQLPGYIANIITKGIAVNNVEAIKDNGLAMLTYTVIGVSCAIAVCYLSARISALTVRDIRNDLYRRIINFSHAQYEHFEMSSLLTRCTNDLTHIQNFTDAFIRHSVFVPIISIGGILKAIEYSSNIKSMEIVMVIGITFSIFFMAIGLLVVLPKSKLMQKQTDKISRISSDALVGMLDIRSLNKEEDEKQRFKEENKKLEQYSTFYYRIMQVVVPAMTTLMFVLSIVVLVIIARVVENIAEIADMMAFIQYVMQVVTSLALVALIMFIVPRAMVAYKRINEILNADDMSDKSTAKEKLDGNIIFENVCFDFDKKGKNALNNVSFTINAGEMCAIVGTTGAGKSSVIRLLTKLITKDSGSITIGNKPIEQISQLEIRDNIACVMQKSFLFKGSIKSNVAYSNQEMEAMQIENALNISSAKEFVNELEHNIYSEVKQDGANLSGGQKQRLNIARAIAKDAQIYLFDDSFSALDFKTDLKVRQNINTYLKDKTIIVIAQRISTIINADKIILLDKGEVKGIGTHEQLLKNCPQYNSIVSTQLEVDDEE